MSDKKDTSAPLWYSEVLSVKHSPCETVPDVSQRPDDGAKGTPAVTGQDTGDVFPDDPPRAFRVSNSAELKSEVTAFVIYPTP